MAVKKEDEAMSLALERAEKPSYAGTYEDQLKSMYDKIADRPQFSYDPSNDAMYKMYADKYQQMGKQAMKDTMGQAAALTGGYNSSYGQAVGQQAYDAQLRNLNDVIPELYNMAYKSYAAEGDRLADQYAMLGQMAGDEYSRYRDELGDYYTDLELARADEEQRRNEIMTAAEERARYGDFSGYNDIEGYGTDFSNRAQAIWNMTYPDQAYQLGAITADEYKTITGEYPAGYSSGGYSKPKDEPKDEPKASSLEFWQVLSDLKTMYNLGETASNASKAIDNATKNNEKITDSQVTYLKNKVAELYHGI